MDDDFDEWRQKHIQMMNERRKEQMRDAIWFLVVDAVLLLIFIFLLAAVINHY